MNIQTTDIRYCVFEMLNLLSLILLDDYLILIQAYRCKSTNGKVYLFMK